MKRFEGRTVLATGGALGIGRAIVKRFHSDDASAINGANIMADHGYTIR